MDVKKIYPHTYHKTCKEGRPIYIELLNKVNMDTLFKATTEERILKYYIKEYERTQIYRLPSCSKVVNKFIEQSIVIKNNPVFISQVVERINYIKNIEKI